MSEKEQIKLSKYLSLVLRHKPESIGLVLDTNGWADIEELVQRTDRNVNLTFEKIRIVVENSEKKRFALSDDLKKIRANQGHSIPIDLNLEEKVPPDYLYHGTATRNLTSILASGLQRELRHHVHLSEDTLTAQNVGQRYGKPVVLKIRARQMYDLGISFFQSENGVWLTDSVAPEFIESAIQVVVENQGRQRKE